MAKYNNILFEIALNVAILNKDTKAYIRALRTKDCILLKGYCYTVVSSVT